ncbi:MAG: hypothetical protein KDD61_07445 [Bdellovibrionales bacterium]|nr:hypothetical protein [Bdellovibrionales bacterium]
MDIWERINSEDFQHDFEVIQTSSSRKYRGPNEDDSFDSVEVENYEDRILYSLPPPGSPQTVLMESSLEDLVDAIEERGWTVTLNRRAEDM